ncbi:MAG: AzlC family ABC transporter permease [Lachnospiraceae bacterium]|jgi:4-azaleucine resistance transporter AzlC
MGQCKVNFQNGVRDGIPIGLGYLAVSFTLGIAAKNAGLTVLQATVMSLTNLTSAGEFAAIGLISAGASYWEMAITQLIINLRYLLMSCALSQKLDSHLPVRHRYFLGLGVTDEIFGISIKARGEAKLNPFYTYGAMSMAVPGWTLGTCMGVIMGNVLPVRLVSALSVALYGMFLAVILPPARTNKVLAGVVAISMLVSFGFDSLPIPEFLPSGMKIILLTVVIAGAAAVLFPIKEEEHAE